MTVVLCALAAGCGASSSSAPSSHAIPCPGLHEVHGRVVAEETGRGIPSAELVARGHEEHGRGHWDRRTTADEHGAFQLCVPDTDQLEMRADHSDFGLQTTSLASDRFSYHGPLPEEALRLELRRGAILRGRLLDPSGRPLADHVVAVYLGPLLTTCMTGVCSHIRATTDARGEFRFARMVLSPDMRLAWGPRDPPGGWPPAGRLLDDDMATYVAAARAGDPVELVVAMNSRDREMRDLDEEFRQIVEETSRE